ncbi:MAG: Mitochondrial GTPase [Cirrosporium novae-zelandiae]|nr:MAG: Mitochondrial GTPase [Cirrosporium novae-zelandiae]
MATPSTLTFIPRAAFPPLSSSIPRAYFLGHHRAGLQKMKSMTSLIDLVIECRDARIPVTGRNEMFEESLGGKPRLVVYTKGDLMGGGEGARKTEQTIRQWDSPTPTLFSSNTSRPSTRRILNFARAHSTRTSALTGTRMLVVGMPNVGKSTLLNSLRNLSLHKRKAAATGAQPGITRKVGTSVKIIEGEEGRGAVYLLDTPGVFVPYVPDAESMLKLALCGNVKDTIVPPTVLADYLLFRMNLSFGTVGSGSGVEGRGEGETCFYAQYAEPTNDVMVLLDGIARRTGRLRKGGEPDFEAAALWFIQRWRMGLLGKFLLDDVSEGALERRKAELKAYGGSMNQAIKAAKELRKQRALMKRNADAG